MKLEDAELLTTIINLLDCGVYEMKREEAYRCFFPRDKETDIVLIKEMIKRYPKLITPKEVRDCLTSTLVRLSQQRIAA